MNEQEMKARFEELAPWHVNGTLTANDRQWVERYVSEHPDAAAELAWYESLQAKIRENAPVVAEEFGWDKLQRRIRQERPAKAAKGSTWRERLTDFLSGMLAAPRPALAYAALALVVVQAGVIGMLVVDQGQQETEMAKWRKVPTAGEELGPVLRVSFKADAPEREIRMLLVGINGTLIGGPGQLGDYIIRVPSDKLEAAKQTLAASRFVDSVDVMVTVPTKD